MTENEKKIVLQLLKVGVTSLFSVLEPTQELQDAFDSDFRYFSQSKAFELLRYLLVASGVNLVILPQWLELIDSVNWKSIHKDSKSSIEKYKMDILQSVKDIFQKHSIKNMCLRKSDLISPNNFKYMKCSLSLTNIALNHQLKKFGIELPHTFPSNFTSDEFLSIHKIFKEQEEEFKEGNKAINSRIKESIEELGQIKVEIDNMKEMKKKLDIILEKELKNVAPPMYLNIGNSSIAYTLASWTKEIDEISLRNDVYFKKHKMFDEILKAIITLDEKLIIDGNELTELVSPEMLSFAENNGVDLLSNDVFNVLALLKIVSMTLSTQSELLLNMNRLFKLKMPSYQEELVEKLRATEEKIEYSVQKFCSSIVNNMATENGKLVNNEFPPIGSIQFPVQLKSSSVISCRPFIDTKKLERTVMLYKTIE